MKQPNPPPEPTPAADAVVTSGKMKQLWALRHVFGTLLAFGLIVALFAGAVMQYPKYVGIGVILLIGVLLANQPRVRRERARERKEVDEAFRAAYAPLSSPPSLAISSSYGYPTFEITFRSKSEREAAATHNEVFKVEIQRIFQGAGPRRRPFRAELAIFFTYDGYLDELRARYKTP